MKSVHPHIFNIPAGADFLSCLLGGLHAQLGADLEKALILLPTRRSCAALRDAFLQFQKQDNDFALILPRICPLAEMEEEELLLTGDADFTRELMRLPPAVPPMRRRLFLMQRILERGAFEVTPHQAFQLAEALARFFDETLIQECDFANLAKLVPEEYAEHWQKILSFLSIISHEWREYLKAHGLIEGVERRQRLTRLLITHWQKHPPATPIIAAGSTGSQPVMAEFLKAIAQLPQGYVVLPGLDETMDEESWNALNPSHPQYLLSQLLKKLDVAHDKVSTWHKEGPCAARRAAFLSEIMRPSDVAEGWRHLRKDFAESNVWQGLSSMEAANEHQEAAAAALILREAIAQEGNKTAALITPNRSMAARVAAYMRRWGIEVDDSAGRPFAETPLGSFFALLLEIPRRDLRPSLFLALLKHPFSRFARERIVCLELARTVEEQFFRQQPCGKGLSTWEKLLLTHENPELHPFIKQIQKIFSVPDVGTKKPLSFWLDAHLSWAEAAAGSETLWRGEEGEVLAAAIEDLRSHGASYACTFEDYTGLFTEHLTSLVVRQTYGQHPRLHILGVLEARLLSFDKIILAGLNEGTWPQEADYDPWMSPSMHVAFGLPASDQRIGQAAHDFAQLAALGTEVILLRSQREGQSPTIPSRWWLRMEALAKLLNIQEALKPALPWLSIARHIDDAKILEPCVPPAVSLTSSMLPQKLSATAIELLMRDPYAFYAKEILKLRPLGDVDAEFSALERGNAVHEAIDSITKAYPDIWPVEAAQTFIDELGNAMRMRGIEEQELWAMRPRLTQLAQAYWEYELKERKNAAKLFSEMRGKAKLGNASYDPMLSAKADRITLKNDGTFSITDYKTGKPPSKKDSATFALRPQLLIEAVIASIGGYETLPAKAASDLLHVKIGEAAKLIEISHYVLTQEEVETVHRPGLSQFLEAFSQKTTRFHAAPRASLLAPAPDYARLARVAEWSQGALAQEEF
jgi:ATP-dependent helicase/nuclease subunit B